MIEYMKFWAADNPFLLMTIGIGVTVVLATIHHVLYKRGVKETFDALSNHYNIQRDGFIETTGILEKRLQENIKHLKSYHNEKMEAFDLYSGSWKKVRDALNTLVSQLVKYESTNQIERSLVKSLKRDCEAISAAINSYLMDGIDPDGSRRRQREETVKSRTDAEGNSNGQEEVSRIQSANEVQKEHQRTGEQS